MNIHLAHELGLQLFLRQSSQFTNSCCLCLLLVKFRAVATQRTACHGHSHTKVLECFRILEYVRLCSNALDALLCLRVFMRFLELKVEGSISWSKRSSFFSSILSLGTCDPKQVKKRIKSQRNYVGCNNMITYDNHMCLFFLNV